MSRDTTIFENNFVSLQKEVESMAAITYRDKTKEEYTEMQMTAEE